MGRRHLKFALLSAAFLLVFAGIALQVVVDRYVASPRLKPRIEAAASVFLGRPLTIESLQWRRWPSATLVGRNVRLYEDPGKTRVLVDAPVVEAHLSVLSIFKLAAGVTELRFIAPRISLRRDKDGVWNAGRLVDEISARPDEPGSRWGSLAFNWFSIEGGTATVEDAAGDLATLSPLAIAGRGKLRFGRRHLHFPFELSLHPATGAAEVLLAGDLGDHTRLNVDVKHAQPSLARLAWPAAAKWSGLWDGAFDYDNRRPARWKLGVHAAPLVISTGLPTFDSLEATGEYFSPSSATFSASALSAGTKIEARGATENGEFDRLSVDVKNANASLAGLVWPPAASWTGRWNGSLDLDESPPARWRLHVRAAPLSVSAAAPPLDLLEASGDYLSSGRSTFSGMARSSTTEIDVKGSATDGALALDVKSPRADLATILTFARAAAAIAGAKRAQPARRASAAVSDWPKSLTATLSADDLRYGSTDFRGVRAVVRHSKGPYLVERLTFSFLGGTIAAGGSYSPAKADDSLKLDWKATGVGVQEVFRLFGSTRDAGGLADSVGHVVTGLGDRFLPAMNGAVKLDVKNGWTTIPGVLKALSRLNLTTLFAEAAGHHRQRVPYDDAHASVTIKNGLIRADKPIVLENKTLQMAFLGTYDLPARTVDGRIVVNFLGVTDEIIGLIPGVRDILLGKEKGLIPIWLRVKGNASNPDIDVIPTRTIAAPFWNATRRVLRLPKTLFQKLKL